MANVVASVSQGGTIVTTAETLVSQSPVLSVNMAAPAESGPGAYQNGMHLQGSVNLLLSAAATSVTIRARVSNTGAVAGVASPLISGSIARVTTVTASTSVSIPFDFVDSFNQQAPLGVSYCITVVVAGATANSTDQDSVLVLEPIQNNL